jgi:hypothetical protein
MGQVEIPLKALLDGEEKHSWFDLLSRNNEVELSKPRGEIELLLHWPWHITEAWQREIERAADERVLMGAEQRRGKLVTKEWKRQDKKKSEEERIQRDKEIEQREKEMICAACGEKCRTYWVKIWDQAHHLYYFYNNFDLQVLWEEPEAYTAQENTCQSHLNLDKLSQSGIRRVLEGKVSLLDRGTQAKVDEACRKHREDLAALSRHEADNKDGSLLRIPHWVEVYDPAAEGYYFWDNLTGEVTWDTPDTYILASDDITIRSVVRLQCCYRYLSTHTLQYFEICFLFFSFSIFTTTQSKTSAREAS